MPPFRSRPEFFLDRSLARRVVAEALRSAGWSVRTHIEVFGDRDQEARAVSPRLRTGAASQGVPLGAFVDELRTRIVARELWPAQVQQSDDGSGGAAEASAQREASTAAT